MELLLRKKVLVLGLGSSGIFAAAFLIKKGAYVTAVEKNQAILATNGEIANLRKKGMDVISEEQKVDVTPFYLIVVSPGVSPQHPLIQKAKKQGKEVIGEVELACRFIHQPMIGITGTNGKTTVSFLVAHVLNACGRKASVLGNSGIPLTSLHGSEGIIVCELSSYQLETMQSKVIDCAAILNITPDHLDRYSTMQEYARCKFKIAECLKEQGALYLNTAVEVAYQSKLNIFSKRFGFNSECDLYCDHEAIFHNKKLAFLLPKKYRGKSSHDVENMMAAFGLCFEMGVDPSSFKAALESFQKPPHRIEFVAKLHGVSFYNDSKGTNLDAVIRAVESMSGQGVLIAGGQAKTSDFSPWLCAFENKVRHICAIGQAREQIKFQMSNDYPLTVFSSLEEATKYAYFLAKPGEFVLLSPGCASFDMFKDYKHRGDRFKEIVFGLAHEGARTT